MTVEVFSTQALEPSAELARRWVGGLLERGSTIGSVIGGLVASTDLQITAAVSGLKAEVAAGEIYVPGSSSSTQGGYYVRNTATATLTFAAANGTNPRIERVVVRVKDAAYAGSENLAEVTFVEGKAKAGATLGNLEGVEPAPASSYTLGYVLVPAKATSLTNSEVKNSATQATLGLPAWKLVETSGSVTAADANLIKATGTTTVTTPAAAKGTTFGVLANNQTVTIKAASGNIYGDFLAGVSECKLVGYQHLQLISDGANWFIAAGEPKREGKYTAREGRTAATAYTPSTTRPVMVSLQAYNSSGAFSINVKVGGVLLTTLSILAATGGSQGYQFETLAGESWEYETAIGPVTVETSYREK